MLEIGDYNFRICICCSVPSNEVRKSGMGFIRLLRIRRTRIPIPASSKLSSCWENYAGKLRVFHGRSSGFGAFSNHSLTKSIWPKTNKDFSSLIR